MSRAEISALPGFEADVADLPRNAQVALGKLLNDIQSGKRKGKPLEKRRSGDLSDCLKVYFDSDPEIQLPRYRLVYRATSKGPVLVHVEFVSVGLREGLEAYARALTNLGR